VLAALIIVAAASLITAFQRIWHVWRATGGESAGWANVAESYEPQRTAAVPAGDDEEGPGSLPEDLLHRGGGR
jgi:hypothetical protein